MDTCLYIIIFNKSRDMFPKIIFLFPMSCFLLPSRLSTLLTLSNLKPGSPHTFPMIFFNGLPPNFLEFHLYSWRHVYYSPDFFISIQYYILIQDIFIQIAKKCLQLYQNYILHSSQVLKSACKLKKACIHSKLLPQNT